MHREQWPSNSPLPEYEIIFTDGCTVSRLHNVSDRPANFPTLDTLPRDRRPLVYSDAYDSSSNEGGHQLRINPTIETAVANAANLTTVPQNMATTWEAQHPTVSTFNNY